jgi:S-adenosylmethionine uptake transporter
MFKRNTFKAFLYFIFSLALGSICDIITKYLSSDISSLQINFIRLSLSSILLLPFVFFDFFRGKKLFDLPSYVLRGIIFGMALCCWGYGLGGAPIFVAGIIGFLIPVFVNILAIFFLNEKVQLSTWAYMATSFLGVMLVLCKDKVSIGLNLYAFILLVSAFLFALMDVLNKKIVDNVPISFILFYPTFFAALAIAPFAMLVWKPLSTYNFAFTALLSVLGTALVYCIITAFSLEDLSFITPAGYLEIVFSTILGYFIFGEKVGLYDFIGGSIVLISMILMYRNKF